MAAALTPAMETAARQLKVKPPFPSRPKHTWLEPYFRRAGIDGMTDPFFLETLLASNLVDIEEPAALAHEWGHLAGFADESEASYFGWLTCLSEAARTGLQRQVAAGPREDFQRIAARLQETDERIRSAANTTYDRFLKVNKVAEGIESYDAVVRLVVGVPLDGAFPQSR
jgi:hypothetical protein